MNIKPTYKVVLLGESTVGKTSLIYRLNKNKFSDYTESTIGMEFTRMQLYGNIYNIWDTAGQERYRSLCALYYRSANILFLVFDLSNPESIDILKYYKREAEKCLDPNTYKFIIIGNKKDLVDSNVLSSINKLLQDIFYDIDKNSIVFVSAKTGENIYNLQEVMVNNSKLISTCVHNSSYLYIDIFDDNKLGSNQSAYKNCSC